MAIPTRASKRQQENKRDSSIKRPVEHEKSNAEPTPKKRLKKSASTEKEAKQAVRNKTEDGQDSDTGISYWLMKAEPEPRLEKGIDVKFSIDDLAAAQEPEGWDGKSLCLRVRNAVARNNMRRMKKGELAFFYHSNCKVPGIAGIMEIVKEHSVDETAQDPKHPYFDSKATPDNPRWSLVHVEFRRKLPNLISLKELQEYKGPGSELEDLQTLRQSRLSVSKVSKAEWDFILSLVEE